MKTIYCFKCGLKIGKIIKGTYQKGSSGICKECKKVIDREKLADQLSNIGAKNTGFGDIFKDIL